MVTPRPDELARRLLDHVDAVLPPGSAPLVLGLDGRSGSGKSTLARTLAELLEARGTTVTVIEGDDFYGGGSAATWDARDVAAKVAGVIDWRRQREVLHRLRDEGSAEWAPFDWYADDWDADEVPLVATPVRVRAADVVVLEGAYSCRPELHDLLDLRVLLDIPADVRRRQLLEREGETYRADWEARWSAAEAHYFGTIMPPAAFDLVVGFA